ncbi:MAG: SpoIID/LytB domain-containing protein [Kineosporiaceae bacterium]|nr:SpoIID/LytB domain-containing protein [Aeromicrobium sp.]
MHSWRLIHRCAAACLAFAMVMTGFVLSRAGEVQSTDRALDTVVKEQTATQKSPEPTPETAPTPDTVQRPKPVAKVEQTSVPAPKKDIGQRDVVAELPDTTTSSFAMVGVTWSAASSDKDVKVQVRTRTHGTWSGWEDLSVEIDSDPQGRHGTDPLWVGNSDGVAARVTSLSGSKPVDIKIATVDPGASASSANLVVSALYPGSAQIDGVAKVMQTADGAPTFTPQPPIVMRSAWGASLGSPCDSPLVGSTTKGIIVHHTAGANDYTKAESAAIVRATQAYHVKGRNWCDIGYNFLVDKYGQIFEGRRGGIYQTVRAAHSGNLAVNTYTLGVSMMGNLDKVRPTAATQDSMVKLIGWRMGTTYLEAKGTYSLGGRTLNKIAGHRNVVSTGCPGKYGYAWLSQTGGLRDRVEDYIAHYVSSIKTLALKLGVGTTGLIYRGEYPTMSGRRAIFANMDIYSTSTAGAHPVSSYFLTEYKRLGFHKSPLKFPTSNPVSTSDPKVALQRFQQGSIYRITQSNGTKKALAVWNSIATTYKELGEFSGKLGVPTTSVVVGGTGNLRGNFARGYITYTASTKTTSAYDSSGKRITTTAATTVDSLTVPSTRKFTLKGHGYGHGIGMSQYGAQGAAIKGHTYPYILRYYYKGTSLGTKAGNIRVLLSKDTTPDVIVKARNGLQYRNVATNKIMKLPAKIGASTVTQWRIVPVTAAPKTSTLQYKTTGWKSYNATRWTGDAQFEAPGTSMEVVMPDGSSTRYRNIVRSSVPAKGSSDRATVNIVNLEHYVRGVISAEMPSSWKPEALKAQAVAARTYGVRGLTPSRYYDLCDTTSCQVYKGVSAETAATDAAVNATSTKIVTYQSKPAFTQFSSSSGGRTAAGSQPYLLDSMDSYDDFAGNPVHNWTISIAAATVEKKWPTIGTLATINVIKRTGGYKADMGGRVVSAILKGSKGSKTVTGNDLRFALGLRSNWFGFN